MKTEEDGKKTEEDGRRGMKTEEGGKKETTVLGLRVTILREHD